MGGHGDQVDPHRGAIVDDLGGGIAVQRHRRSLDPGYAELLDDRSEECVDQLGFQVSLPGVRGGEREQHIGILNPEDGRELGQDIFGPGRAVEGNQDPFEHRPLLQLRQAEREQTKCQ